MPTMTALGVPHFAGRPSTLLRQIIVPTFGGGAAAATGLGVGGDGGEGALAGGEHAEAARATPAANTQFAGQRRMFDSKRSREPFARSKFNMARKIC